MDTIRIALDAMGGDHGPSIVVPAAAAALKVRPQLRFRFFGDSARIAPLLTPALAAASETVHTDIVIASDEKPSQAIRKKGSSMHLAIQDVEKGAADCVISAGNTGALMANAKLILRMLPGIDRPAIATMLPSVTGRTVTLDLGANLEVDANNLVEFAIMGACFARAAMGVEKPTVGILNIGSEDTKGHEYLQDAAAQLESSTTFNGEFIGFVEGNQITGGGVDVVVTDGFTGNVALKTAEGVGKFISQVLKQEFSRSIFAKLCGLAAYVVLKRAKKRMDHREYNGAMFLGLNKICIKSHGGADAFAFSKAILVGADMAANRFNEAVADQIQKMHAAQPAAPVTVSNGAAA